MELVFKEGPEKNDPALKLVRTVGRDGQESYQVQGKTVSPAAYKKRLKVEELADALKTIIRQEQINDLLSLLPSDRLRWISGLSGKKAWNPCPKN